MATDPEAHTTQNGVSRSNFKVAVQRRFRGPNGEREADFLPVVAWRQTADFCNRYLTKGRLVSVEGSIQVRSYDAQDGSKRYVTEIVAENVTGLERSDNGSQPAPKPAPQKPQNEGFTEVDPGDELPF